MPPEFKSFRGKGVIGLFSRAFSNVDGMPPSKSKRQATQPSKFGIDHFFALQRASQARTAPPQPSVNEVPKVASPGKQASSSTEAVTEKKQSASVPDTRLPTAQLPAIDRPKGVEAPASPEVNITPTAVLGRVEVSASADADTENLEHQRKRVRLSPLLPQTQDDGADEVIWEASPTVERLQAGSSLPVPEQRMALRPCQKNLLSPGSKISPGISEKLEQWLSSCTDPSGLLEMNKENVLTALDTDLISSIKLSSCSSGKRKPSPRLQCKPQSARASKREMLRKAKSGNHRKVLLELLDQVQSAITQETTIEQDVDQNPGVPSKCEVSLAEATIHGRKCQGELLADVAAELLELGFTGDAADVGKSEAVTGESTTLKGRDCSSYSCFSVLEVSDIFYDKGGGTSAPQKVLRLLEETTQREKIVNLRDEWFFSGVKPGHIVNVVGDVQAHGECVIDHDSNLLVLHPEILISASKVGSSYACPRRAVFDERIKSFELSLSALLGTMLHRLFQIALSSEHPSKNLLEERAHQIVLDNIDGLYAVGGDEKDALLKLIESIPAMLAWRHKFKDTPSLREPQVDFGLANGMQQLAISEVVDIEEMVWSPKYGLKGMIDASLKTRSGETESHMPLEFKTGKATSSQTAMEHRAQVILYTLLMSDRYSDYVNKGILYYIQSNETQGVAAQRADLSGLMMRRNEHADNILQASLTRDLPPMLQASYMCKGCRMADVCSVYHKLQEGGTAESSGLGEFFNALTGHLTHHHGEFLQHWDRLIDLEARCCHSSQSEIWRMPSGQREQQGRCLSSMVLQQVITQPAAEGLGEFAYSFLRSKLTGARSLQDIFVCGDYVVLSTESGHAAVAGGVIKTLTSDTVTVSLPRPLRLPRKAGSLSNGIVGELWRIDKDDRGSSFAIMRYNLLKLFVKDGAENICRLVVDLEAPTFSTASASHDPYVRSVQGLNEDQRDAIQKILTAEDYALILGMPGTGKTSTIVYAVKALVARGSSVLLASYTNSAVDNILLKLKHEGVAFVRVGRPEAIHPELSQSAINIGVTSVEDLRRKVDQAQVVGATCFGISHALFSKRNFDVCIVDEAGQITLPVCLGPLRYSRTFVLVGDHHQLPPLIQSAEARKNGMDISLFRKLSEAHPSAVSALHCQYRMCLDIMKLSNTLIYGNRLTCGSEQIANAQLDVAISPYLPLWTQQALDPSRKVLFLDTDAISTQERRSSGSTVQNITECSIALHVICSLRDGGVDADSVGVISPYKAQVDYIMRRLADKGLANVEAHTIDRYQGRDKDCILLSFVKSKNQRITGSLLTDWHRINVAITRAKKKLIFIGSSTTLSSVPLLKLLIDEVRQQGGFLSLPEDTLTLL